MKIAENENKEGLLPMKEGEEQEKNKTFERKNIEICNFIKNAFCVDGSVELIFKIKPVTSKLFFKCKDSKRGKFWVAYGDLE